MTDVFRAFMLIIVGLSGDPEHAELFLKWGNTLTTNAVQLGVPRDRIQQLNEQSTKEDVEKALDGIAKKSAADDVVFIVLIGHGSFAGGVAKFNLKGPDMTAADFNVLLKRIPSQHVVFVDTASSSGPFKDELAGPGRTIISATRNGAEQYDTVFPGLFIDAFASDAADVDKNHRVTIQEAYDYATREVTRAYERLGLLATEHSVIDDAGKLAGTFALGTAGAGEMPSDPKLRALYIERREMEQRVEALKVLKSSMEPARYAAELERLVTDLARKGREIRQAEGK